MSKTKTVAQMIEEAEAAVQDKQRELERFKALAAGLPNLPYKRIYGPKCAYKADLLLGFEVQHFPEVLGLVHNLDMVPLKMVRGTFRSFLPADADHDCGNNAEETPVLGLVLKCQNITRPTVEAEWWTDLTNGKRAKVSVEVANVWDLVTFRGSRRMSGGAIYWKDESFSHRFPGAQQVKWGKGSSEYMHSYTLYWPVDTSLADIVPKPKG